jgi:hypothetical protein
MSLSVNGVGALPLTFLPTIKLPGMAAQFLHISIT